MGTRQLPILPYTGKRTYQYYIDGLKVNGKRQRLFFKDSVFVLVAAVDYQESKKRAKLSERHLDDLRCRLGRFDFRVDDPAFGDHVGDACPQPPQRGGDEIPWS
jgi:hypothetical protein